MTDFRPQQAKALKKLFASPPGTSGSSIPEKFLLQYVLFEATVRLVGRYYKDRNGEKQKSSGLAPLEIDVVKRSFQYFSIQVSSERLELILNSKLTKRMEKSARNLRNGLVHQWKAEDVREVTDRYAVLENAVAEVIDTIKMRTGGVVKGMPF